jgi:O-antigen ligase
MLAAGNVYPWNLPVGRIVRWAALALLAAAALGYALTRTRPRGKRIGAAPLLAAALVALAFASVLWSPDASLTLGRATTLLTLFVAGWALAYGSEGRHEAIGQILLGLLAGAVAVAIGGLLNLWAEPDRALVPATTGSPARYNGLGGNPNTTAMLLAVALPLAAWAVAEARSAWGKATAVGAFVLLDLSMTASGSRGAILAAFVGLLALVPAFAADRRGRALLAIGATALLAANLALTEIPPNADRDPVGLPPEFGDTRPISPLDLEAKLPLQSEIGFPTTAPRGERELLQTSGRAEAWRGALQQASERPVLGYGFGTEEHVFVDRWYVFLSDRIENSFLAALLQLGVVGLAALGALLAVVVVAGLRSVARPGPEARAVAACLGIVAAGLALALTQSFMTSVGSPATPPFWLALALLTALGAGSRGGAAAART